MNLLGIVTRTQRQFGDDSGVQIYKTDIINWANDGQIDIVRRTECLQDHKETSSVAQDGSYSLPSDFLFMRKVTYDKLPLRPTTLELADQMWPEREVAISVGTPQYYYIWGNILYLYPAPAQSGSGNLDIWYVRTPATMTGDFDIPEIPVAYHEAIVRYCLSRAKELDDSFSEASAIMKDYEQSIVEDKYEAQQQQADTYPAVRLLPGDDW